MHFEIIGNWKEGFEQDGLLYCAQRIEEMVMGYTSHLYKVPVYNTLLLAYEYLRVYEDVHQNSIDNAHLGNILEEFIDSFSTDIVVKEHLSVEQIPYFIGKLKGSSPIEQMKTIHYLVHLMQDYPNWCVESLTNAINNPKEKKKIEKALRSYVPMIIGIGYHSHYIYRYCKKFSKEMILVACWFWMIF